MQRTLAEAGVLFKHIAQVADISGEAATSTIPGESIEPGSGPKETEGTW